MVVGRYTHCTSKVAKLNHYSLFVIAQCKFFISEKFTIIIFFIFLVIYDLKSLLISYK